MLRSKVLVLAAAVSLVAFAGCVGDAPEEVVEAPPIDEGLPIAEDGRDLRTDLIESDSVKAPNWQVGESFGVHVFFGPQDTTGAHYNTIVIAADGSGYTLAPDDPEAAKDHAVFDIPIFGKIEKDLTMTAFGGTWKMFDFPLTHEKTWTGSVYVPSFDSFDGTNHELTFTARYAKAIATPEGPRPGFEIEGVTSEGQVLIKTDYTPAIGWNAHFYLFDIATETPDDYLFHTMSMGHGLNWTGTYYLSTASDLLAAESVVGVNPDDPTASIVEPDPHHTFTVPAESTYMYGFIFAGGFTSQTEVVLVDPNNEAHQFEAQIQPMAFGMVFEEYDEPAIPGEWRLVMGGVGVVSFAGAFLWEITEATGTL